MKAEKNVVVESMKRGFTLIELLVVVSILGILAAVAVVNLTKPMDEANANAAGMAVRNIKAAVISWMASNHKSKPPTDLKVLVQADGDEEPALDGGEGALFDPWDHEYRIEVKGKRWAIVSDGPDGQSGTEDDIRSDKVARKTPKQQ